ncbi:MAG TPA: hypothetical protein VG014_05770 [Acidimicrobiales bacterium]|nr:hypothetical protein [Acidimicrobiales bacterium]
MSISEVAAFLRLISATGLWDDGATLKFTIEGGPIVPTEFYGTADEWWAEQWGSAPPKYHRTH